MSECRCGSTSPNANGAPEGAQNRNENDSALLFQHVLSNAALPGANAVGRHHVLLSPADGIETMNFRTESPGAKEMHPGFFVARTIRKQAGQKEKGAENEQPFDNQGPGDDPQGNPRLSGTDRGGKRSEF
jgi:hypothetical protein